MATPTLSKLLQDVKSEVPVEQGKKFIDPDTILTILIYQGIKMLLPELREWIKLGFSRIVLKRLEIEKRLKKYALEKELYYDYAEKAASKIAQNINEKNIKDVITELENNH